MKGQFALCSLLLTGCVTMMPPREITLNQQFDFEAAMAQLAPGNNTISGSALIRQQGGGVVTCAGMQVNLYPVNPYSIERIGKLMGSDQEAYMPAISIQSFRFVPEDARFVTATKHAACDSQGMFEFAQLADGEYFVTTAITWQVGYVANGGVLMKRVHLAGGEVEKVVLSPRI